MKLKISITVQEKLANKTPPVTESEIIQCFANRDRTYAIDVRAQHRTNPITQWFIAETDFGRELKVAFMATTEAIVIKSAYDPSDEAKQMYADISFPL